MEAKTKQTELSRIEFLKGSTATLALMTCPLLTQCANLTDDSEAAAGTTLTSSSDGITVSGSNLTLDLTSSSGQALQDNGGIAITDQGIVITKQSGTYQAFSRSCTHSSGSVNISGGQLKCNLHAGVFDLDGSVVSGPPSVNLSEKTVTESGTTLTVAL